MNCITAHGTGDIRERVSSGEYTNFREQPKMSTLDHTWVNDPSHGKGVLLTRARLGQKHEIWHSYAWQEDGYPMKVGHFSESDSS